jgi:hypothetical protein
LYLNSMYLNSTFKKFKLGNLKNYLSFLSNFVPAHFLTLLYICHLFILKLVVLATKEAATQLWRIGQVVLVHN